MCHEVILKDSTMHATLKIVSLNRHFQLRQSANNLKASYQGTLLSVLSLHVLVPIRLTVEASTLPSRQILYTSAVESDCEEEILPGATQSAARFGIRDGRLTDNELLFFAHARWITKRRPSSRRHIAVRLTEGHVACSVIYIASV